VFDSSALVTLFRGNPRAYALFVDCERGLFDVCLPTAAVAEAEAILGAGLRAWDAIVMTRGAEPLPLSFHAAVEVGPWQGRLGTRQVIHEAIAMSGAVVTTDPDIYPLDVDVITVW